MKRLMYSGTGLLVLLLAFVAFNMASNTLLPGARIDLTEQKLYTISEGTREILTGLEEPVTLYFFFSDSASKDMVILRNYARRVEELLQQYERVADGKINLQIIDPRPFSEAEDRAAEFGLHRGMPPARPAGPALAAACRTARPGKQSAPPAPV